MPVRSLWSNVAVAMQSALSAGQDVSSITLANPGVLTYVGADPTNGNYILLDPISGMSQVNERVFRVANVVGGSNTLELEAENTTGYTAATASTAAMGVITFGTSFNIITDVNASGGEPEEVDFTTIHDVSRVVVYGAFSPSQFTMDAIWDPADPGLAAMVAASRTKAKRAFRFSFANGYKHLFYGQVACLGDPTGTAQGKVTTPLKITRQGGATFYTT